MRVSDAGEFGLIAGLRRIIARKSEEVICGIGDDAAVFRAREGGLWAFTADAVVEGVHFDLDYVSWHALGYKALAVNLSDLAAVGGSVPSYALVTLGLEGETEIGAVEEMYRGLKDCGEEYSSQVVGGDVVRSPRQIFVSVSMVGFIQGSRFLARGGARPGQVVMVTGSLGDSYLGWRWLSRGGGEENECARKHLYPRPRLEEGRRALALEAAAAIDVSDGLLLDLGHICEESGVGAEIMMERIPISSAAAETAGEMGEEPLEAALHGGEDYELILVADARDASRMQAELDVAVIGEITAEGGVRVLDPSGRRVEVDRRGYEHFKE